MILHGVMYLGMNLVFLYWDRNGIFEQYKLHRTPLMGPSEALMQKTWREAVRAQYFLSLDRSSRNESQHANRVGVEMRTTTFVKQV